MSAPIDPCLESLKLLVLAKAGTSLVTRSDIALMIAHIAAVTGTWLSETTLLRAYGFLPAKFAPSSYAKDILARYCGYENYAAFCTQQAS
jgi:hypothetical protein